MFVKLEPITKYDYHFIYELVSEFFKTNLNVMYMKLDSYEDFVKKSFVIGDTYYIVKNRIGERMGYVHIMNNDEIGYFIDSKFQRMGYGTEAVKQLMKLHPRKQYFASININNIASNKVIKKLGFHVKGSIWERVS